MIKKSPGWSKKASMLFMITRSRSKKRVLPERSCKFEAKVEIFIQPLSGIPLGRFKLGKSNDSIEFDKPDLLSVKQTNLKGLFKFLSTMLYKIFT